jgi:hypothetical protein
MQVALLTNSAYLDEELPAFRCLAVGLLDEGVRLVQVVPDKLPVEDAVAFAERVAWSDTGWGFLRRRRIAALADALEKAEVDVVHATHPALWPGAIELAEELEAALVVAIASEGDIELAQQMRTDLYEARAGFSAATQPLAEGVRKALAVGAAGAVGESLDWPFVSTVRTGVLLPDEPREPADAEQPLCATVSGGDDPDCFDPLFRAIASVIADHPEAQFFLDAESPRAHDLWRRARRLGLLSNVSMVPHRLGHRELELGADVLIHPQPLGRSRGLTLHAMGQAIPVLARADPWLDYLIDDETAWLVDKPDARRWEELLRHLIVAPEQGRSLGLRARQWIRDNHTASKQIASTMELYRQVTGEAMKFPG